MHPTACNYGLRHLPQRPDLELDAVSLALDAQEFIFHETAGLGCLAMY